MFGEDDSESPRLPSPWQILSRSAANSPSPLSSTSTPSAPGTPPHYDTDKSQLRRQASDSNTCYEAMLAAGLVGHHELGTLIKSSSGREDGLALADGVVGGELLVTKLGPEVDKEGHIEYKLKLPTPTSPHRLAKLITQLRWRLVEGGGVAMYELGVLDSGVLVGLGQAEMNESLQTLGRMLAGLGGGQIRITRVVQVGGAPSPATASSEVVPALTSSSCSSSSDGGSSAEGTLTGSPPSASTLFKSFTVDAIDPTCYTTNAPRPGEPNGQDRPQLFRPTHPNPPMSQRALPLPINHGPGPNSPYPERPPEERLRIKRMKRDARRLKRQQENERLGLPVYPFKSVFDLPDGGRQCESESEGHGPPTYPHPHMYRHRHSHGRHQQRHHPHQPHQTRADMEHSHPSQALPDLTSGDTSLTSKLKPASTSPDPASSKSAPVPITPPAAAAAAAAVAAAKLLALAARKPRPATGAVERGEGAVDGESEARYVVEAVVTKAKSGRGSRRRSSGEQGGHGPGQGQRKSAADGSLEGTLERRRAARSGEGERDGDDAAGGVVLDEIDGLAFGLGSDREEEDEDGASRHGIRSRVGATSDGTDEAGDQESDDDGDEEDEYNDLDEKDEGWSFLAYDTLLPPVRRGSVRVDATAAHAAAGGVASGLDSSLARLSL